MGCRMEGMEKKRHSGIGNDGMNRLWWGFTRVDVNAAYDLYISLGLVIQ